MRPVNLEVQRSRFEIHCFEVTEVYIFCSLKGLVTPQVL